MQSVEKKKRRPAGSKRWLLLPILGLVLAASVLAIRLLDQPESVEPSGIVSSEVTLFAYPVADVTGVSVTMRGDEPWSVTLDEETGCLRLSGEDGFLLSAAATGEVQSAAAIITCDQVFSEDPAEYEPHLADYGLAEPEYTATITFRDGTVRTLHVGSRPPHTSAWYYMLMEGDDRLFALSTGMVEALFVSRESLRDIIQPVLHKVRIDRLTLLNGDGSTAAEWTLPCDIDETDAAERWQITAPFVYPADATAVSSLLTNAANLRLGAYVGPATAENLAAYGFTEPRMSIVIHMAAGAIGTTSWDGAYTVTDWPESTVTFVIGGARSDMVDYVFYEDNIYVSNHFTMGVFLDIDPRDSMNRYPVLTALGNLASLTIEENGVSSTYVLTRTEQVAPNNDLVYDEEGNIVWDLSVSRNGEPIDAAAFEAAYTQLASVRVGGVIPEGDTVADVPHTIYTFTDVDGSVSVIALTSYGVLHDAVSVNGHQAFYMTKDAFRLGLE